MTMLTGDMIWKARLVTLARGLQFEVDMGNGYQMTRGRSCSAIIKDMFGFPKNLNKSVLLEDYLEIMEEIIAE